MAPNVPVSVGIPVRNGAARCPNAIRSVLAQDFSDFELVISDNGSTDATEEVCREFARSDARISYYRQAQNIGLLNNFQAVLHLARGDLCWVGDDDTLEPSYVSRCKAELDANDRFVLAVPQVLVSEADGTRPIRRYDGAELQSTEPADRLCEMLRLLNDDHAMIDPLSALIRRGPVASISRKNMLREDQVYACKLALAGPWGLVPEVLTKCTYDDVSRPVLARRLGLPTWHARVATVRQLGELLRLVRESSIAPAQQRRARAAVWKWYRAWHRRRVLNGLRRVATALRP